MKAQDEFPLPSRRTRARTGSASGQAWPERRVDVPPRRTTSPPSAAITDSGVFLDDITVSRAHATIERRDGDAFFVKDGGSLNGTYVNGEQVDETKLASGDEVQIGMFKLIFFAAGE